MYVKGKYQYGHHVGYILYPPWIYIAYEVYIQMVPANEYVKYTIVQFIR